MNETKGRNINAGGGESFRLQHNQLLLIMQKKEFLNRRRANAIWKEYASIFCVTDACRTDISREIRKSEIECRHIAAKHAMPWICCLDEALRFFDSFHNWAWHKQQQNRIPSGASPTMLISRSYRLAVAIKLLALSGFDEVGRPLARTFHETLDLLLAVLVEDSISQEFLQIRAGSDEDEFWKKYFWKKQKGNSATLITNILQRVSDKAGMSKAEADSWINQRAHFKKYFSGPTHIAASSVLRSAIVFSLEERPKIRIPRFGHPSIFAPWLMLHMAQSIWDFGGVFLRLMQNESLPSVYKVDERDFASENFRSMLATFFTLQQLVLDENLPKLPQFEDEPATTSVSEQKLEPVINQSEFRFTQSP